MKNAVYLSGGKSLVLILILSAMSLCSAIAQDIITKKSGEEIRAKVVEIGISEISYKKFENLSGPTYKILKSDVIKILYENGAEDAFEEIGENADQTRQAKEEITRGQYDSTPVLPFKPYFGGGFNLLVHNGIYGSTVPARPDGGEYNPNGSDPYLGLGFGVNIDFRAMEFFAIHFDINNYTSTTPVAYSGGYATSDWVWEMNDYGSRLIGPFSENANYNINNTGMRLGLKIYPLTKKHFQPWYGIYYGYYNVTLGVFNDKKKSTYGNVTVDVTGLTFLNFGIDFWDKSKTFGASIFAEFGSPVVSNYKIEDCLHNGWTFEDYGEGMHIFGYNRFGISLNFASIKNK